MELVRQGGDTMQTSPVQDAKVRFSEFLEKCLTEGPQMVTRRGAEAAVLRSLKELLLSDEARAELPIPARGAARRRTPSALG